MIYLTKKDSRNIQLYGSSLTQTNIQKIKKKFSYRPKGKYNPIEKKYDFEPVTSVFDSKEMTIPIRFLFPLARFLNEEGIEKDVAQELKDLNPKETVLEWWQDFLDNEFQNKFKPYKHQQQGIINALVRKNCFLEVATSGGKSFIIYAIVSILKKQGKKCLIVTDTATLVNQLKSDFISYSSNPQTLENEVKVIHTKSKDDKYDEEAPVFISTYKSMANLPPEYFKKFDCLIVDEAHKALAPSVTEIINNCWHASYIVGMSGKIKTDAESKFKTIKLFGEIIPIITAKELIDRDMATPLSIIATKMRRPYVKLPVYNDYIEYVCNDKRRLHFIVEDVLRDGENMIMLFNRRIMGENILEAVREQSKKKGKKYIIEYIDGTIPTNERDKIKELFINNNNVILVASYKTIATGVNAPNLRGIALVEPMKAELTIVQAIGRTLRLNKGKEIAKVYDYGDSYGWGFRHMKERLKTYTSEGHSFEMNEVFIPL